MVREPMITTVQQLRSSSDSREAEPDVDETLSTSDLRSGVWSIPLWHNPGEALSPDMGAGTRFRLAWVEDGTGILRLGERRVSLAAPVLLCLNETERPRLLQGQHLQARAIYFHPNLINHVFTFENVRGEDGSLSVIEQEDRRWLKTFVERGAAYHGAVPLEPVPAQRTRALFNALAQVLAQQTQWGWACRARSYLLELLFLLEHLRSVPWPVAEEFMFDPPYDINPVVTYLHTHYQEKITISQLARIFNTNRTTLAEQFRASTGVPVITYLIRLRIRLAAYLLRSTILPVSEILERVGFTDSSHFGRMFHRVTGYSPTEYRQRTCWHPQHFWLPRQQVGEPWRSIRGEG